MEEAEIIKVAVEVELCRNVWSDIFVQKDKEEFFQACLRGRYLRERTRQSISDAISSRKRSTKDKLLETLGYTYLVSRMKLHTTLAHIEERDRQKKEEFCRLCYLNDDGVGNMSFWRDSDITKLFYPGSSFGDEVIQPVKGDTFFRRNMSPCGIARVFGIRRFSNQSRKFHYASVEIGHMGLHRHPSSK